MPLAAQNARPRIHHCRPNTPSENGAFRGLREGRTCRGAGWWACGLVLLRGPRYLPDMGIKGLCSRAAALLVAGVFVALLGPTAAHGYSPGRLYFQFQDAEILESSGVVASSVRDGLYFTHNDSPAAVEQQAVEARVFAADDRGCTLVEYALPGAMNQDWEDIARGPSPIGSALWIGDIGDNNRARLSGIDVYRIAEPNVNNSSSRATDRCPTKDMQTVAWSRFRLKYIDGPHDAETLLVHPSTGQLFVVTKSPTGTAVVYAAPPQLVEGADNLLTPTGAIVFPASTTLMRGLQPDTQAGYDVAGRLQTTGGDISADGTKVVIRTYTDAWEWDVVNGDVAAAFRSIPRQIPLLYAAQGEAVGYTRDGRALVTTCERFERICDGAHIYEG